MRKVAIIAMFAIVSAMVPMSTAGSQPFPVDSLSDVFTIMLVNPGFTHVEVWIENDEEGPGAVNGFKKYDAPAPSQQEIQLHIGNRAFTVCTLGLGVVPTTAPDCTTGGGPAGIQLTSGSFTGESNDIDNAVILTAPIGLNGLDVQENDTDKTGNDEAKLTVFNFYTGGQVDFCVGDELVLTLPAYTLGSPAPMGVAEFDSKDGEGQDWMFFAAGLPLNSPFPGTCDPAAALTVRDQGFPSGSNLVLNFTGAFAGQCGSFCGYQIFPGEKTGGTSNDLEVFCQTVLEAANITPWLQDLFNEVEVGDPDTYPDKEKIEKVFVRIAEILELGNQTAPPDIRDAWLLATQAFVETGRLAAADYDLNNLSQDDLRTLVESIEQLPTTDNEEELAATEALTAWVPVNCFGAVEAEPSFTG